MGGLLYEPCSMRRSNRGYDIWGICTWQEDGCHRAGIVGLVVALRKPYLSGDERKGCKKEKS